MADERIFGVRNRFILDGLVFILGFFILLLGTQLVEREWKRLDIKICKPGAVIGPLAFTVLRLMGFFFKLNRKRGEIKKVDIKND